MGLGVTSVLPAPPSTVGKLATDVRINGTLMMMESTMKAATRIHKPAGESLAILGRLPGVRSAGLGVRIARPGGRPALEAAGVAGSVGLTSGLSASGGSHG